MRHPAAALLLLLACSHSRDAETSRAVTSTSTTTDREREREASSTSIVVGPTDTVSVEADFAPAPEDAGAEVADAGAVEVVVPVPEPDGGVRQLAVRVPRAPPGQVLAHVKVTEQHAAGSDEHHAEAKVSGKVETGATAGTEADKEKVHTATKVGLSLVTKLAIAGGIAAALALGVAILRKVPRAAVGAIPVVGPLLVLLLPKESA